MKKYIGLILSFLVLNFTCISAASDLIPPATLLSQISIQYKWFDNAENRAKGLAPEYFASIKKTATNKFQRFSITLFLDTAKSVSEILDHLKAVLGVPIDNLKVRLGISRKDRVMNIPLARMQEVGLLKVRYVPPKNESE